MLDEAEFAIISKTHKLSLESVRSSREKHGTSLAQSPMEMLLAPICQAYTELTGFEETNANAVWHHRISLYGPPCEACGKPLRTPQASFCAECGHRPS